MPNLTILSRDVQQYCDALAQISLPELTVLQASDDPQSIDPSRVEILLSEPDLAAQVLPRCHQLRWLQSTWAGNKPLIAKPKRDYKLTAVKGIFTVAMREYVFAYLLYFSRAIDRFHPRQGEPDLSRPMQWHPPKFGTLAGRTLGILGAGSIASGLVPLAKAFDMRVIGLNRRGLASADYDALFKPAEKYQFAKQADYVVSILPDTPATVGFIDQEFLKLLPKHCVLINAGRGNAIVEADLLKALDEGWLRGAVLDVFEKEPLPSQHPFWHHPRVWVTQHTAAISSPQAVAQVFADNYLRYNQQQPLNYEIDFDQGY
ncbi:D-2-hydroxyacid dehydrogenase [Alteromonas sp. ASW11-36]|uniref:D-2-hydroxyacid dehydrogenase n=1 Tax=Alteromonas arenosi TaxID=3055817 RepID=A0ABT7T022_9ALTE|nr:D-2-hydroxyacid dehydrogenase [Alteromonas sp. ASW11-36]MDM7861787.1 D-2-hydroxyacid dehydrogenase [Alteromonas sp. ASW11-36]